LQKAIQQFLMEKSQKQNPGWWSSGVKKPESEKDRSTAVQIQEKRLAL